MLPIPIPLESFEALTCYNTFLKYYNLTPLKSDQTIRSFMKHLKGLKFNKLTRFSINKQLNVAHIYLPYTDNILQNYTLLDLFTLSKYYNTPLKSFTNIILLDFDDNLDISNTITNPLLLPHTNSNLNLNIVTHNMQGFNILTKRQL